MQDVFGFLLAFLFKKKSFKHYVISIITLFSFREHFLTICRNTKASNSSKSSLLFPIKNKAEKTTVDIVLFNNLYFLCLTFLPVCDEIIILVISVVFK